MLTYIGVSRTFYERLSYPYSECVDDLNSSENELVRKILATGYGYNQNDCFILCFQKISVKKCGCLDPSSIVKLYPNYPYCLNMTQIFCNFLEYKKFFSQNVKEICKKEW